MKRMILIYFSKEGGRGGAHILLDNGVKQRRRIAQFLNGSKIPMIFIVMLFKCNPILPNLFSMQSDEI